MIIDSTMQKPSLVEIKAYIASKRLNVNPDAFFDYYEANGWHIGPNKMYDWRACCRQWSRNATGNYNIKGREYSASSLNNCITDIFNIEI